MTGHTVRHGTGQVKETRERLRAQRAPLQKRCRKLKITHEQIRERAGAGDHTAVVHWFAGRLQGKGLVGYRIELAVKELLAEATAERVAS